MRIFSRFDVRCLLFMLFMAPLLNACGSHSSTNLKVRVKDHEVPVVIAVGPMGRPDACVSHFAARGYDSPLRLR